MAAFLRARAPLGACGLAWLVLLLGNASVRADPVPAGEVAHLLDRVLPLEQRLELRYLRHLGWRFVRDPSVAEVVVDGGHPCRYRTLARAQAAGALRIRVPAGFGEAEARALGARLAAIADGAASRCAYQHRLAPALRRAVGRYQRLVEPGRYQFPELFELINSPFWGLRLPQTAWTKREHDGVYVADGSAARAIESIWQRGGVAECYTGQWLAIFGGQYELYGGRWFDEAFAPEDLQIGKPLGIKAAPIGKATRAAGPYDYRALLIPPEDQGKDAFLMLAPHGPMAFVGIVGIMQNSAADGAGMNENWLITQMSPAALEALATGGGVAFLDRQAARVWEQVNASMSAPGPLRVLQEPSGASAAAIDRLLAQPVFSEIWVYVHPYGVLTFGDLMRTKFIADDTPPKFTVYRIGRESLLYRRYHAAWKERCRRHGVCR